MLTLKRFKAAAAAYGADLERWPEELRAEAQALTGVCSEARACFNEARSLDEAIEAASAYEVATLWSSGDQQAALARVRSAVNARIASSQALRQEKTQFTWTSAGRIWTTAPFACLRPGMAVASGVAIIAGLLIGMSASAGPQDAMMTMLQPSLMTILVD